VVSSAAASVTVDRGFNVTELANELRDIKPGSVSFTTVPISTPDYQTPTGESAVLWNQAAADSLFHRLSADEGLTGQHHPARGGRLRSTPHAAQDTAVQAACR
jgi:hypothetical protein